MTAIISREALAELGAPELVYVREIKASELLGSHEIRNTRGIDLDPEQTLYAVHSADGECLAVMLDRDTAFATAIAHELAPVSVH